MAEIAFTKLFKLILTFGYWGSGLFFINDIADGAILENLPINTALQNIAASAFIAMTLARLIWFLYDKFYLETRERKLKMESDKDDLDDRRAKRLRK